MGYAAEMRGRLPEWYVALCNRVGEGVPRVCRRVVRLWADSVVIARGGGGLSHPVPTSVSTRPHVRARQLFLHDHRPELYAGWIDDECSAGADAEQRAGV